MAPWLRGLLGALALLVLAQATGVTAGLDRFGADTHWRWKAAHQAGAFPAPVLVVAIDDKTLQQLGRLKYWTRARYAQLLQRLGQAAAVGIDILFDEPDDRDPAGDRALAEAVKRHGRAVVNYHYWGETRPLEAGVQGQLDALQAKLPHTDRPLPGLPLVYPHNLQPPIPVLLDAAGPATLGYPDLTADADGVYRHAQLLKTSGEGALLIHHTVAAAALARRVSLDDVLREAPARLRFGDRVVPLEHGEMRLRPVLRRGGGYQTGLGWPAPTISFVDALALPPERFKDRIVLIGETATGTTDKRPNPLDNGLRGVELNAEILANLLSLPVVRPLPSWLHWLLLLAGLVVPLWLYASQEGTRAGIGAAILVLLLVLVLEGCFWFGNMLPSGAAVIIAAAGSTLLMTVQRVVEEERQKGQIRDSFSLYVAPELVAEIVADPTIAQQEGVRQVTCLLFSDIRSFTTYCEQHPPEVVVPQMRQYLGSMADSVDAYKGVLDKFIGDAVMALWGPFLEPGTNVSALAIACALDMSERLKGLNEKWQAEGLPLFRIGIGIHLGDAIVGNIGSERRMQYTALGDAVNLAARLESSTKELQAEIVVSDSAKEQAEPLLGSRCEFVDRGVITVKGREQPVRVYQVVPRRGGQEVPGAQEEAVAAADHG